MLNGVFIETKVCNVELFVIYKQHFKILNCTCFLETTLCNAELFVSTETKVCNDELYLVMGNTLQWWIVCLSETDNNLQCFH